MYNVIMFTASILKFEFHLNLIITIISYNLFHFLLFKNDQIIIRKLIEWK